MLADAIEAVLPQKLRGSGIHGPENTDLMKLVLWNRLKQKRPQREVSASLEAHIYATDSALYFRSRSQVPNINYLKDSIRLELSVNWWLMSKFHLLPLRLLSLRFVIVGMISHRLYLPMGTMAALGSGVSKGA